MNCKVESWKFWNCLIQIPEEHFVRGFVVVNILSHHIKSSFDLISVLCEPQILICL